MFTNMLHRKASVVLAFVVLAVIALLAQSNQWSTITPSGAVTGCPATTTGNNGQCSVTDGYYVSVSGGPYQKLATVGSDVTSWNTRTGAVMPAAGDYTFAQVAGQIAANQLPATTTCNVQINVTPTGQTITLSSCH